MIDSHGEAVILGIKRTAAVFDMHKECAMDENDKWVAGHVIDRFGDKPGFKTTPSINAKATSTILKMELRGYVQRRGPEGNWYWTEKAKGFLVVGERCSPQPEGTAMKIHHWKMSETLKRYSTGDIIILAEDADAARAKATAEFEAYLRREDSPLGVYWTSDGQFLTEMDEERYSELLAALALDLAKEPSADEEAIFILGS